MEAYTNDEQIQLIKNLSLVAGSSFDKVIFELIEFGTIDPWLGTLAEFIAKGEEVDECGYCSEVRVIIGTYEFNGEKYCADCYEEE